MKLPPLFVVALLAGPAATVARAQDAASCIRIERAVVAPNLTPRQRMTNVCRRPAYVRWCHSASSRPATSSSECGTGGRWYQAERVLEAGQSNENQYTLPVETTIHFAACYGGFGSLEQTDRSGRGYSCRS